MKERVYRMPGAWIPRCLLTDCCTVLEPVLQEGDLRQVSSPPWCICLEVQSFAICSGDVPKPPSSELALNLL